MRPWSSMGRGAVESSVQRVRGFDAGGRTDRKVRRGQEYEPRYLRDESYNPATVLYSQPFRFNFRHDLNRIGSVRRKEAIPNLRCRSYLLPKDRNPHPAARRSVFQAA